MGPQVVNAAPRGVQVQGGTCQLHSLDAIVKSTGVTVIAKLKWLLQLLLVVPEAEISKYTQTIRDN